MILVFISFVGCVMVAVMSVVDSGVVVGTVTIVIVLCIVVIDELNMRSLVDSVIFISSVVLLISLVNSGSLGG